METSSEEAPLEEKRFVAASQLIDNPQSKERSLDADELEKLLSSVTRSTARQHLEQLISKLRRDAGAIKRAEESHRKAAVEGVQTLSLAPESAVAKLPPSDVVKAKPNEITVAQPNKVPLPSPAYVTVTAPLTKKYVPIDRFAFDAGGHNSQYVTLYIDLPGIGSISKDNIKCEFTSTTVDLEVHDLSGKSYRMYRDNLDKDINAEKCKYIVKPDKILIKLAKCKGEYGSYDYWTDLTAKKKKKKTSNAKEDPTGSIMELMKEMYDGGDDKMKKMIGETMLKQQRGELGKDGMGAADPDFGKFD